MLSVDFIGAVGSSVRYFLATVLATLILVPGAMAQNPPAVQTFYVPIPEDQGHTALESIYPGQATCGSNSFGDVGSTISTTVSIAVGLGDTYVYYDQWEDGGYDADIVNPTNVYSSPGNLSGTQIWGDGDTANGSAPGYPGDVFSSGDIIILQNDVPTGSLTDIDFDGRDKIAASSPIAVTRALWADGTSTLLAGAVEVYSTSEWGTDYEAPVGEDTPSQLDMFEYTSLVVMAATDGTTVAIDADANGVAEISITLDEGESYHVDGGVDEGATVSTTAPVQVDLLTGHICTVFESRFFTLLPTAAWSDSAYTPVSSHSGDPTYVFVYNPGPGAITVNWETTSGLKTPLGIAAGATNQIEMTNGEGAHFFSDAAAPFFAVSTIDAEPSSSNSVHDWGFSMIPASSLTQQALVGWGPGKDPTAGGSENSSPVWVMPALLAGGAGSEPFDICVDYDGDLSGPLTDAYGNDYDVLLSLNELEPALVYDSDGDQTGMVLYVCDGSDARIAVVWGQDPDTASQASPAIDVGTTIPPLERLASGKAVELVVDVDMDTEIDQGDTLEYTIIVQNVGRIPASGTTVEDTIPADTSYVAGSTEIFDGASTTPVADAGATLFPLDEGGLALPDVPATGQLEVTFQVTVNSTADVCGESTIVNSADVDGSGQQFTVTATSSVHCNPDIHIEKATNGSDADSPPGPSIVEGDAVTWTYEVTNPGDVPLANVIVGDDQGVTVTAVDVNTDMFNDGDLDLDDLLDPGETWSYTASGTATLGEYKNIGTAEGGPVDETGSPIDDGDGTPFADVSDDDPSHYNGVAEINLNITKDDRSDPVLLNGTLTYDITVGNAGPSDATGVTVSDTLDPDTTYVSNTGGCIHAAGTLTCALGSLASGATTSFEVTVTVNASAPTAGTLQDDPCDGSEDLCNITSVTANETESDPSDNSDDEPTNVIECSVAGDCSDPFACTAETCVANICVSTPVDADCDDTNVCTDDTCSATTGCVFTNNTDPCADGNACNGDELCGGGTCNAGTPLTCDDTNVCTDDSCVPASGCVFTNNTDPCADGNACNGDELCGGGSCNAGTPLTCDDTNVCTDDSCVPASGCVFTNNTDPCADANACNGDELCGGGTCNAGTPLTCDDTKIGRASCRERV